MGEYKGNKNQRYHFKERMMVVVNRDWSRTYVASINTFYEPDGAKTFSAKCRLKDVAIVSDKKSDLEELSINMNELATIIEEYTSRKLPYGERLVKDIICGFN